MATKYQALTKAKGNLCKGKTTKAKVRKAASAYVKDAVKKGAKRTEAKRIANRVMNSGCSVSTRAGVGKRKKRSKKMGMKVHHVIYGKRKRRSK